MSVVTGFSDVKGLSVAFKPFMSENGGSLLVEYLIRSNLESISEQKVIYQFFFSCKVLVKKKN